MSVLSADKASYILQNGTKEAAATEKSDGFYSALGCLTSRLSGLLYEVEAEKACRISEIRIRTNKPLVVTLDGRAHFLFDGGRLSPFCSSGAVTVDSKELEQVFVRICGYSVHSCQSSINSGYITIEGGHRAGIAGTAVCAGGTVTAVRDISCINLRIAREVKGAAEMVYNSIFSSFPSSAIIAGAPSSGKTTLLRDLARLISGGARSACYRTVICDERGEIAAVHRGVSHCNVGVNCDILTGYPKSEAVMLALRCFSPEIIICDEVGTLAEIDAISEGLNSGVAFLVSVHAASRRELTARKQILALMRTGVFDRVVLLEGARSPGVVSQIYKVGDLLNEACCSFDDNSIVHSAGQVCIAKGCLQV